MSLAGKYLRMLAHLTKWIAIGFGAVAALNAVLMLVDWIGGAGWRYQWYAMPVALFMVALAILLRKLAIIALRKINY